MTMSGNNNNSHFGDTTHTKVFVGGLAWETPKEAMHHHFQKYGEILEAVIISDKVTGRSKGYGFVTFKDPEAAKKACEDGTPMINGRRANCNLAALGARRPPRSLSATPPLQQQHQQPGSNGGSGNNNAVRHAPTAAPAGHVQWYYPAATAPAVVRAHQHHQALPFYGFSPAYIAADHVGYNQKLSYRNGGAYMNGHYTQMYPGQAMIAGANTLMPMYPFYPYTHHHQAHQQAAAMVLLAHMFPPTSPGPLTGAPQPILSKPTIPVCIAPPTVCLTAE